MSYIAKNKDYTAMVPAISTSFFSVILIIFLRYFDQFFKTRNPGFSSDSYEKRAKPTP